MGRCGGLCFTVLLNVFKYFMYINFLRVGRCGGLCFTVFLNVFKYFMYIIFFLKKQSLNELIYHVLYFLFVEHIENVMVLTYTCNLFTPIFYLVARLTNMFVFMLQIVRGWLH